MHCISNCKTALVKMESRYVASMILSAVGDCLGFKNGQWEFCRSAVQIHKELEDLGGLDKIVLKPKEWIVSDDTVMHIATAEALVRKSGGNDTEALYSEIAEKYKSCMKDMEHRAPGLTTVRACNLLNPSVPQGYKIPFSKSGGGCGAAMRAMCIGLRYPKEDSLDELIAVSVESGRMTHHHPTGYLGSLTAALFTAYAIQEKPVKSWGQGLLNVLPKAKDYVKSSQHCVEENMEAWSYFEDKWKSYLEQRGISDGHSEVRPEDTTGKSQTEILQQRDEFYTSLSFDGWGGASGHDAPMIAYDALLYSGSSWSELCHRAMLHGGDSDSTGVMAAAWWGAIYGFQGVPPGLYQEIEYKDRIKECATALFKLAFPEHVGPKM